jgi:hypothetical protein
VTTDEATRLQRVLERTRKKFAPELSSEFVASVAELEERNQFDDDRVPARSELRRLVEIELEEQRGAGGAA